MGWEGFQADEAIFLSIDITISKPQSLLAIMGVCARIPTSSQSQGQTHTGVLLARTLETSSNHHKVL